MFSTIDDLAKWNESFDSNALGAAFTRLMLTRMKFQHDRNNDAFGLVFGSFRGHRMLRFSGEDPDTSTYMARFPDEHLAVICLSNMPTGDTEGKAMETLNLIAR